MGVRQGTREQRFFARHPHRFRRQGREQRNHEARQETRLAGMQFLQVQPAFASTNSVYN